MKKLPLRYSSAKTKPSERGETNTVTVKISKEVKYILTVGFEVNYPAAFYNNILNLSVDFGHAFFYVTKRPVLFDNDIVDTFFSFGPAALGEGGKITDEYNGERQGNTKYAISEKTKMFRLRISQAQAEKIKTNSNKFSNKVDSKKILYDTSLNNTCAETERDILSASHVLTPDGHGSVIGTGNIAIDIATYNLAFVNPYMWFKNFYTAYGSPVTWYGQPGPTVAQKGEEKDEQGYKIEIEEPWILLPDQFDPLPENDREIIHGDIRS